MRRRRSSIEPASRIVKGGGCIRFVPARIGGGLLYAASSNVPWAILLARTFEVDIKACARCGARLLVRAVVTDHEVARKILDALPRAARAPPSLHTTVALEPAFA